MSLLDVAAQNASLDNDYGATKGANAPAAHQVAIFTDHPDLGGVELDSFGGYARVMWTNNGTNWPAASGGQKVSADVVFATSSDEWQAGGVSATGTYWVLFDNADGTTRWDCGRISDEVSVSATGAVVTLRLTIYYGGVSL